MKGFNMKKIAALGLGAALVGSALAPVVSAAAYDNLDSLERSNVVSDAGVPVVDVVGGSNAMPSDIVWAGNIATRIAQLATVSAGDATGETTVDVTVGGTQTLTGSGNVDENYISGSSSGVFEFNPLKIDQTDVPKLVSGTQQVKHPGLGSSYVDLSVDENASVTANTLVQTAADKEYAGELVAEVDSQAIKYTASWGTGFPSLTADQTQLDSNSSVDIKVPMLGKSYIVDEIGANGTSLIMFENTNPTELSVGESIEVSGVGDYEGKTLTVELVDLVQTGSGTGPDSYQAKWALKDGDTVLKYVQKAPSYDLKDEFGTDYFDDSAYVSLAGLNLAANTYTATVRTGSSRIEVQNGKVFPYTSTVSTTNAMWKANILKSSSNVTGIEVYNSKQRYLVSDLSSLDADEGRMGPLSDGEEIEIPGSGYLKFTYNGMQSKKMADVVVGDNKVVLDGTKGVEREIPLYIELYKDSQDITIGGKQFTVDVNTTDTVAGNDGSVKYFDRANVDVATGTALDTVDYNSTYVNTDTALSFPVDNDWLNSTSGKVDYYLAAYESGASSKFWLLLAGDQTFDVDDSGDSKTGASGELFFAGTEVDQNLSNGTETGGVNVDLQYYLPDQTSFAVLSGAVTTDSVPMDTTTDANFTVGGAFGSFRNPNEGDDYQYNAAFRFNEGSEGVTTSDVNMYVNTQTGYLINTQDNKTRAFNNSEVVSDYGWNLNENTTADASRLLSGITDYGTEVSISGGVATISMPEEARKVEAYLGDVDDTSSVVGGETLEGLTDGQTASTTAGTEVTVDVAGGATGGVSVVPAGDLVKMDTDSWSRAVIVGGYVANSAAVGLEVMEGQTLEDLLVSDGDYVSYVLGSGDIVVAGKNAADTGTAASALIDALEALM